jgi:hypothetical protein
MIDFELSDDQRVLQASVREMCERLIVPNARRWDEEETFPHEVVPALGEMGLLGMQIPEKYGGAGMKFHDYVIALEEVARADASIGLTMASHNSLCTGHIYLAANEAQKQKYLPRLASGKSLGAWGLTEPGSGSDAGAARTRAVRKADKWVISGTKTFITQGSVAEIYVVLASTSPEKKAKGLTAFIVEKGTPGFRTGKRIEKMGLHASDTTELVLEEVEVGDEQRLGEIDAGFFDTLRILDKGPHRHRRLVDRDRARRVRGGAPLRQGARPVRQADRRVPGDPAHARRHGDRAGRGALAGLAGGVDAGPRAPHHRRIVDREVLRRARDHARVQLRGADPRRLRLHARVRRRALPARREAGRDRRGHQRGPEDGDRARAPPPGRRDRLNP